MPYQARDEVPFADGSTAQRVAPVGLDGAAVAPASAAGQQQLADLFGVDRTILRAPVDASASGDNPLVAASAGQRIHVLGLLLVADSAVDAAVYSGPSATGTALTGPVGLAEGGGFVLPPAANAAAAWLATEAGEALTLNLSAAVQVSGCLVYRQE